MNTQSEDPSQIIRPKASILQAIKAIDDGRMQIALIVSQDNVLRGVVTDGDIRRGLLKGLTLEDSVDQVMSHEPITGQDDATSQQMIAIMRQRDVQHLPIIDAAGKLVRVERLAELMHGEKRDNLVVLMAGGLGSRLKERTENTPKPLLNVGGKPILETIIENFCHYGFSNFVISTRYLADQIRDHFGDGEKWGARIDYIEEETPLGTAGALSLLKEKPTETFIVMNGDVLTKISFRQLLRFHDEHVSKATMCVRGFSHQVPYGVVNTDGVRITHIEEKPVQDIMVNAGIYALEPEVLELIPHNEYFDMPTLFEKLIADDTSTAAFPIHEYWMDVGQPEDFEKAGSEYRQVFG